MNELHTLKCPSCGGSLQVSANTSVQKCEHCGIEHLVRRDAETLWLESFTHCPKCGRNDRIEKVSAIARISNNSRDQQEQGSSSWANRLKPSDKPDILSKPQPPNLQKPTSPYFLASIILFIISGLSFLFLINWLYNKQNDPISLTICGSSSIIFLVAGVILLVINKRKQPKLEEKYQEMLTEKKNNYQKSVEEIQEHNKIVKSNWEVVRERWEKLYYCHRDDCIFIFGEDSCTSVDNAQDILYRDLPKPPINIKLKSKQPNPNIQQPKGPVVMNYQLINKCPNCGSTNVSQPQRESMSCIWVIFIFISMGLALIFWFFTPKYVTCHNCGAKWKI